MSDYDGRKENVKTLEGTNEFFQRRLKSKVFTNSSQGNEEKNSVKVLHKITMLFKKMKDKMLRELQKKENEKEWERYLSCDGMPYPELPSSVRHHFLTWCHDLKFADFDQIDTTLTLYLPVFDTIKILTDFSIKLKTTVIKSLRETIEEWKYEFQEKIDYACFVLIKEIRKNFMYIDYYTRNYIKNFENFKIGMWTLMDVPLSSKRTRNRRTIHFPNLKATVSLPWTYNSKPMILRVIYTPFDLLSDLTNSRYPPEYENLGDLLTEVKRCEELMETVNSDLSRIQRDKDNPSRSLKQSFDDKQFKQLRSLRSLSSVKQYQESKMGLSLDRLPSIFLQKAKYMSQRQIINKEAYGESDDRSRQSSIVSKRMRAAWEFKQIEEYRNSGESLLISDMSSRVKPSTLFGDLSVCSSMHVRYSPEEEMYNDEKNDTLHGWYCSDWEIFTAGESELEDLLSFMNLVFQFEEEDLFNICSNMIELMKKDCPLNKKESSIYREAISAIELFLKLEEDRYKQFVQQMTIKLKPGEVNLRCYHSFCGVHYVDLIKHVSDFRQLIVGDFLQMHVGPYQIEKDNFVCDLKTVCDKEDGSFSMDVKNFYLDTNEEGEIKTDNAYKKEIEKELSEIPKTIKIHRNEVLKKEKNIENDSDTILFHTKENLITVKIPLNKEVYWFMKPQPAVWDLENKIWSVEYVHDVVHDKEHNMIEFKLGKLGPITMFTLRFHELPYKNWTLSPEEGHEEVTLTLEGQHLTIQFKILYNKICLNMIDGWSKHLLDGIIGKFMDIPELVNKMKSIGLDIFPEIDTFLYIEKCTAKPLILEDHSYYTMAIFSQLLEFKASSWNLILGHDEMAFQCRLATEFNPLPFDTVKASNFGCEMLLINDEAESFAETLDKDSHFLGPFSLLSKLYGKRMNLVPEDISQIHTTYNILRITKILTYSGSASKFL